MIGMVRCIPHTERTKLSCVLTHSYILKKDPPSQYEHCHCILTARHIFVECSHFTQTREDIFRRRNVVESFGLSLVLSCLKECQFYSKF